MFKYREWEKLMSIQRNYIYNVIYQCISLVIPFATIPYIARVLGPLNLGITAYTNSIVQYFTLIASLGVGLYGTRQIAYVKENKERRSKVFCGIFYTKTIVAVVVYFVFLIFVILTGKQYFSVFMLQSIYIISAILDISWLYTGMERFDKLMIRNIIVRITGVILVFLIVKERSDLIKYIFIGVISELVGQLIMWLQIKKYVSFTFVNFSTIKEHFLSMCKLYIPQFIIQVYTVFDRTIIGISTYKEEVAYFDLAKKLINMLIIFPTSLGTVMLPKISFLVENNKNEVIKIYLHRTIEFMFYTSLPMFLGLIIVSDNLVRWLYGYNFYKSAILIKIMAPTIFFISISNVIGIQFMVPYKKERELTISVFAGAIMSILSNVVLVFWLKSIGAAISFLLTEATVTIIQIAYTRNIWEYKYIIRMLLKYFIISITMVFILILIDVFIKIENFTAIFVQVIIGFLFYILSNVVLESEIQRDVFSQIKKFLRRSKNEI